MSLDRLNRLGHRRLRNLPCLVLFLVSVLAAEGTARAQAGRLTPLVTDQTNESTSHKFARPLASAISDAGAYVFIGVRGTGLFYRLAGAQVPTRAIQYGDPVPGLAGSRLAELFAPVLITPSGLAAVRADVYLAGRLTHAILAFDGSTIQTLVSGLDTAPNTGGKLYERTMTLIDINANGGIMFSAGEFTAFPTTLFYKPSGGAVVRVAGSTDPSPGTGGTFSVPAGIAVNSLGQVLFTSTIIGGSGGSGLFSWIAGVTRKVAAVNDPNPVGGTFTTQFGPLTSAARLSNTGLTVFSANNSLFQNTQAAGTTVIAGVGSPAPPAIGGTYSTVGLFVLSHSDDVPFIASVSGSTIGVGLFRYRPGFGTLSLIVRHGDPIPGDPSRQFFNVSVNNGLSVNDSGTVSFVSQLSGSGPGFGIFQKPAAGVLSTLFLSIMPSPFGGTLNFPGTGAMPRTLANGTVMARANIVDGADGTYVEFLWTGSVQALMTDADPLPAGGRTIVRPAQISGRGNQIGVVLHKPGGRETIGFFDTSTMSFTPVVTDVDVIPFTNAGRIRLTFVNSVHVDGAGGVALQAQLIGSTATATGERSALFTGFSGDFRASFLDLTLAVNGETFLSVQGSSPVGTGIRPIPFNSLSLGQVAFTAIRFPTGGRALYSSDSSAGLAKHVSPGDAIVPGQPLTSLFGITGTHLGIDAIGRILFSGSTSLGQGLFTAGGGASVKVAQAGDALPGGGTITGMPIFPGYNANGQVVFAPSVSSNQGLFVYTPGQPLVRVASTGDGAPGGGTFAGFGNNSSPVISNAGDVAFNINIATGPSASGLFIKRAAQPGIEFLVGQGQTAPGTTETFGPFFQTPSFNGHHLQLSDTGRVAFMGQFTPAGGTRFGWWDIDAAGSVHPIVIAGSSPLVFQGGTVSAVHSTSNWLSFDRYPVWVGLAGGPVVSGLYLYHVPPSAVTPAGTNVSVQVTDPFFGTTTITFANVTAAGVTSVSRSTTGPPLPRGWYFNPGLPTFFDISTTASYTGTITVCVPVNPNAWTATTVVLRMVQYVNGAWQNVTASAPFGGSEVCGVVTSLSSLAVAMALNEPAANIIQNGTFANGTANWSLFEPPDIVHNGAANGVFEYYKASPAQSPSGQAVILQNTGVPFLAGDPIAAHFDLGNSSSVRKRISVLIHASDFTDLTVCTFWLPPNTPLRSYAMRTHATRDWPGATISFYAASSGQAGGSYLLDNVVIGTGHALSVRRTDCVDPSEPGSVSAADGPEFLTNGGFDNGLSGWSPVFGIATQVTAGVMEFARRASPPPGTPSGVLLQRTFQPVGAGQLVTTTFRMGNPTSNRHRVTVLLQDFSFGDLAACTFWLDPGQPMATYTMRTFSSQPWSEAAIAFYPGTNEPVGYLQLDDVTLRLTPSAPTFGSDCVEPGDTSGFTPSITDVPVAAMANAVCDRPCRRSRGVADSTHSVV